MVLGANFVMRWNQRLENELLSYYGVKNLIIMGVKMDLKGDLNGWGIQLPKELYFRHNPKSSP